MAKFSLLNLCMMGEWVRNGVGQEASNKKSEQRQDFGESARFSSCQQSGKHTAIVHRSSGVIGLALSIFSCESLSLNLLGRHRRGL
jgi:hypothetical protein